MQIASRRAREIMCIISDSEGNEDAEWVNEDDFRNATDSTNLKQNCIDEGQMISDVQTWKRSPWTTLGVHKFCIFSVIGSKIIKILLR